MHKEEIFVSAQLKSSAIELFEGDGSHSAVQGWVEVVKELLFEVAANNENIVTYGR